MNVKIFFFLLIKKEIANSYFNFLPTFPPKPAQHNTHNQSIYLA